MLVEAEAGCKLARSYFSATLQVSAVRFRGEWNPFCEKLHVHYETTYRLLGSSLSFSISTCVDFQTALDGPSSDRRGTTAPLRNTQSEFGT